MDESKRPVLEYRTPPKRGRAGREGWGVEITFGVVVGMLVLGNMLWPDAGTLVAWIAVPILLLVMYAML